jgi:glycosyltransferase involved in cell wall biosynthesis
MTGPRLSVLVERLGPYHHARLEALARRASGVELTVLQVAGGSSRYAWAPSASRAFRTDDLFPGADYLAVRPAELRRAVTAALEVRPPEILVVNGWGFPESRAAIAWAAARRRPVVLFSDSQERDAPRTAWREWLKRRIVETCASALVAGQRHATYLRGLGMPADRIVPGYDVVDNAHFALGAAAGRADAGLRARLGLPGRFFLCCARFVPQKNLPGLVEEYAAYRARTAAPWGLAIAGDGDERPAIEAAIGARGLTAAVHLPGFVQYDALPAWYGLASAFVLPSAVEPWGLVVNEAMAAGLPVLVSEACGCVPELVKDGVNGFTFDPRRPGALAERMGRIASLSDTERDRFGSASREIVSGWTPESWADALLRAVELARARGARGRPWSLVRWLP